MPIAAATKGTLSIMADRKPKRIMMTLVFGIAADKAFAPLRSILTSPITADSNAAIANNMPKKNKILEISRRCIDWSIERI